VWEIRSYNDKGKEIVLQTGLASKNEAELFLGQKYKDVEDVFVAEKIVKEELHIDITQRMGEWVWLWSPKKQEMFPYGILRKHSSMFIKIQTKEDATELVEMAEMRISTVQKWLQSGQGELRNEGHFVTTKEYV
jgi:hypothetical protein